MRIGIWGRVFDLGGDYPAIQEAQVVLEHDGIHLARHEQL